MYLSAQTESKHPKDSLKMTSYALSYQHALGYTPTVAGYIACQSDVERPNGVGDITVTPTAQHALSGDSEALSAAWGCHVEELSGHHISSRTSTDVNVQRSCATRTARIRKTCTNVLPRNLGARGCERDFQR